MAERMESDWTIREVCVQETSALLSFHDAEADLVEEAETKAEVEAFSCPCWFMLTPQTLEGVYLHLPDFVVLCLSYPWLPRSADYPTSQSFVLFCF